jgi:PAS domain S-box-containing protein
MKTSTDENPSKVLIVEDEALVALEIEKNLEKNGFTVVSNIAYGEKVLDEINLHNPDIVLMDIKLKGEISGLTAAEIVNKEKDIPIIFLTAYSDAKTIEKVKEVGAYGYIVKPFHDQELKVALEMGLYKFSSERKARMKEKSFLQFSDQIEDAFIISDKSGKKILFASKGFEKVFGKSQESFIQNSESFLDLIHKEDLERFKEFQSSGGRGVSSLEVEYRILLPDESLRWVVTRAFPVEEDNSESRNITVTVSSDITRKKQTDINFKNQMDFIGDQLVLKNLDLRLKENKIEELIKEKRDVLSNVSHEFKTPLNAILGYGQLLESDSLNNWTLEQKEHLDHILKAGHNLLNLIEKVLGFSKVDSGDIPVAIKSVHLNRLIGDLINQYDSKAKNREIKIINKVSTKKGFFVLSDPLLLKQAFMNLISNAIKFTNVQGTVEVYSEVEENLLRVTILDTGCGIPRDKLEVVFDPLVCVGKDLYNPDNKGLGLAVTKSLIELMNGTISVQSELNVGSRFSVELPLDKIIELEIN